MVRALAGIARGSEFGCLDTFQSLLARVDRVKMCAWSLWKGLCVEEQESVD